MRRVEGGRDWAYALLAKGWNDGCSMPRLTELLASMTVVNAVGAVNEDGEVDPKAPVRAAIDYSDICLKAYPHQTGGIFARLAKRRERLVRLANAAPRPERDLSKAVNLRPVHPQAPGRASEIGPLGAKQARRVPSMAPPTPTVFRQRDASASSVKTYGPMLKPRASHTHQPKEIQVRTFNDSQTVEAAS